MQNIFQLWIMLFWADFICSLFLFQGDVTYPFLPVILFGILCLVAGGLTLLLPETINTKLPVTFGDIKQTTRKNTRPISGDDGAKKFTHPDDAEVINGYLKNINYPEGTHEILISEAHV